MYPEQSDFIVPSLVSGWLETYDGIDINPDVLTRLISIFCDASPGKIRMSNAQRLHSYLDAFNSSLDVDVPRAEVAFFPPFLGRELEKVSKADVDALQQHLKVNLTNIPLSGDLKQRNQRSEASYPPSKLLTALCASCGGNCCQHGLKNHAYLKQDDLAAFKQDYPNLSSADIADEYIKKIPVEHAKGGCLFHGRAGCTLPRKMRSHTCNSFLCGTAKRASANESTLLESQAPVLFVALEGKQAKRLGILRDDEISIFSTDLLQKSVVKRQPTNPERL